ncbi:tyrosine-type recombinase/integrase [Polymorphospora sp. NPDC051019]|uniref:site-specific integrase n=1 Tax=Polymorphospora sp. NPDC051019 TaxID=3155725 RepID=UPI00341F0040
MFLLILHRGLLRGEACGLRDHDIDLDAGHATIVQQITPVGYTPVTRQVKTDAGDRLIPLGPKTTEALRAYLQMRDRWQHVSGADWPDTGLFFVRPDGQPWHPQTVSDRFDHLITTSGLPPVRLHDLRHLPPPRRSRPQRNPGNPRPLQHRPHLRHLHLRHPRTTTHPRRRRSRPHPHAPHRTTTPNPRHHTNAGPGRPSAHDGRAPGPQMLVASRHTARAGNRRCTENGAGSNFRPAENTHGRSSSTTPAWSEAFPTAGLSSSPGRSVGT